MNYHTLADFRVDKQQELDELFTQVLASLSKEGLITLKQVMPDGTKIRALASSQSFQQEKSIREHLERARQRVKEMGDPRDQKVNLKTRAVRQRAREEQQRRLEKALEEVQKLGQQKLNSAKKAHKVSISDPEARFMKQADGGLAPSYNVQISADATQRIIVGVEVTVEASDSAQLLSGQSTARTFRHATERKCHSDGLPAKDGHRGSATTISASRADRRVLPRVD